MSDNEWRNIFRKKNRKNRFFSQGSSRHYQQFNADLDNDLETLAQILLHWTKIPDTMSVSVCVCVRVCVCVYPASKFSSFLTTTHPPIKNFSLFVWQITNKHKGNTIFCHYQLTGNNMSSPFSQITVITVSQIVFPRVEQPIFLCPVLVAHLL